MSGNRPVDQAMNQLSEVADSVKNTLAHTFEEAKKQFAHRASQASEIAHTAGETLQMNYDAARNIPEVQAATTSIGNTVRQTADVGMKKAGEVASRAQDMAAHAAEDLQSGANRFLKSDIVHEAKHALSHGAKEAKEMLGSGAKVTRQLLAGEPLVERSTVQRSVVAPTEDAVNSGNLMPNFAPRLEKKP